MILAYSIYIISLGAAFFASYKYVTYTMKVTHINLHTNLIVASVLNLTLYSLAIFNWFLYAFLRSEAQFINGLKLGIWLYITSEVSLVAIMLYKYKHNEVMNFVQSTWDFIKTKSSKAYRGIKKLQKT
ncbi:MULTISPECIES: hypothetical protein [Paraliobacillus]|uniref:hypothetical protein n=1 Tax=Paraliobacillus TaxID=200903 RepID=UPI000DD4B9F8|nr:MULTISPECIES: hypothetical protein [Paraliobacillus]